MRDRLLVIAVLLALPLEMLAQTIPCAPVQVGGKSFNPPGGIIFSMQPGIYNQGTTFAGCVFDGMKLWDSTFDGTWVRGVGEASGLIENVEIQWVPPLEISEVAQTSPDAAFIGYTAKPSLGGQPRAAGSPDITYAVIQLPNNLATTAGFGFSGGCERIMVVLAHEIGHGYIGAPHSPGSIMQGSNKDLQWGGLDLLPFGPTLCDRDAEKRARTTPGEMNVDVVYLCNDETYTDEHGCPCGAFLSSASYTGYNRKPVGHIQWPQSGVYAPFSGNLDMHAADPDGNVWRVDYRLNGQALLTTTTPPFGFPFNVGPGAYSIDAVMYDTVNEYTITAPRQINVCGGPPPAPATPGYWNYGGGTIQVYWANPAPSPPPGFVTMFQLEAGTYPGGANAGVWQIGALNHTVYGVAPGTYYARVRAYNPCGWSAPSPDITVVVP